MILTHRIAAGVAAGNITVAYRRWRHLRLTPGSTLRTAAGLVRIEDIERVEPGRLNDDDAHRAGYQSCEELAATWRGEDTDPLWCVALSWAGPDPRTALAENTTLDASDRAAIDSLLDRLDARTPWARTTLTRLAEYPGTTAAVLAHELPINKDSLKRRIRTLKEHGLTRSLPSGYELSARGRAYFSATGPDTIA